MNINELAPWLFTGTVMQTRYGFTFQWCSGTAYHVDLTLSLEGWAQR